MTYKGFTLKRLHMYDRDYVAVIFKDGSMLGKFDNLERAKLNIRRYCRDDKSRRKGEVYQQGYRNA